VTRTAFIAVLLLSCSRPTPSGTHADAAHADAAHADAAKEQALHCRTLGRTQPISTPSERCVLPQIVAQENLLFTTCNRLPSLQGFGDDNVGFEVTFSELGPEGAGAWRNPVVFPQSTLSRSMVYGHGWLGLASVHPVGRFRVELVELRFRFWTPGVEVAEKEEGGQPPDLVLGQTCSTCLAAPPIAFVDGRFRVVYLSGDDSATSVVMVSLVPVEGLAHEDSRVRLMPETARDPSLAAEWVGDRLLVGWSVPEADGHSLQVASFDSGGRLVAGPLRLDEQVGVFPVLKIATQDDGWGVFYLRAAQGSPHDVVSYVAVDSALHATAPRSVTPEAEAVVDFSPAWDGHHFGLAFQVRKPAPGPTQEVRFITVTTGGEVLSRDVRLGNDWGAFPSVAAAREGFWVGWTALGPPEQTMLSYVTCSPQKEGAGTDSAAAVVTDAALADRSR
jgi:hypothetical protein